MTGRMTILVATDGSHGSKAAEADALRLAEKLDAEILFVSVQHAQPTPFGVPPYYVTDKDAHHAAVETVRSALGRAAEAGVAARGEVLGPNPEVAHAILAAAKAEDVDLIVVGSRGVGAIAGAILGSVSRSLVRHADRPVLVAKEYAAPEDDELGKHEHFFVTGGV